MNDSDARQQPWALIRSEDKFDCPYFIARSDTVTLSGGAPRPYTHIRMKNFGVAVVPIDSEGCTTIIGQHRYVLNRFTWEVPRGGGRLEAPPLEAAKKELSEETGYRADHWMQLFSATASPGVTDEIAPCFVAWGLHLGFAHPETDEQLSQRRLPFAEAVSMVLDGTIADLASIAIILGIQAKLARGDLPDELTKLLRSKS